MLHNISVEPADFGWMLRAAPREFEMMFLSGAAAERSALGLARRLAAAGDDAEISIWLRSGCAGGCYRICAHEGFAVRVFGEDLLTKRRALPLESRQARRPEPATSLLVRPQGTPLADQRLA